MSIFYLPPKKFSEEINVDIWPYLTSMEIKKSFYSRETYFRECWLDFCNVFENERIQILQRHAIMVFKPDAIIGRRIDEALEYLKNSGFVPIVWREIRYSRMFMREDWRYQLNQLSIDRMMLNTMLLGSMDSLLVVFRDILQPLKMPASVRMQNLKGNSLPHLHKPGQLRAILQSPNRLLKFIHTPDEPADIVREIGIFFDDENRSSFLKQILKETMQDNSQKLNQKILQLYDQHPQHDLKLEMAWQRIKEGLHAVSSHNIKAKELLNDLLFLWEKRLDKPPFISVKNFVKKLREASVKVSTWDFLVFTTYFIYHSFEDEEALIEGDGYEGWEMGIGKMA